jgi:hypothetical protein
VKRAPTAPSNSAQLAIEQVATQFTGHFPQFLQALPSKTTAMRLAKVRETRPDWSEESARLLEAEVDQPEAEEPPQRKILASIGAKTIGAAYEMRSMQSWKLSRLKTTEGFHLASFLDSSKQF